jgi:mono/diheme cytochrome c family protein
MGAPSLQLRKPQALARSYLVGALTIVGVAILVTGCALFQNEHVRKGHELYAYYCSHCHGEHGKPNEGFNWKLMPDPKPKDLSNKDEMSTLKDEEIFQTISRDMKDTTPGTGDKIGDEEFAVPTMPTFKYTLSEEELWALVAYVRTLHGMKLEKTDWDKLTKPRPKMASIPKPMVTSTPTEEPQLAAHGKQLYFNKYGCNACHKVGNTGGEVGPPLDRAGFRLNSAWVYRWIRYPQSMKPETKMPNLGISDDDAKAIMFYLKTLNAPPPEKPLPASS